MQNLINSTKKTQRQRKINIKKRNNEQDKKSQRIKKQNKKTDNFKKKGRSPTILSKASRCGLQWTERTARLIRSPENLLNNDTSTNTSASDSFFSNPFPTCFVYVVFHFIIYLFICKTLYLKKTTIQNPKRCKRNSASRKERRKREDGHKRDLYRKYLLPMFFQSTPPILLVYLACLGSQIIILLHIHLLKTWKHRHIQQTSTYRIASQQIALQINLLYVENRKYIPNQFFQQFICQLQPTQIYALSGLVEAMTEELGGEGFGEMAILRRRKRGSLVFLGQGCCYPTHQ